MILAEHNQFEEERQKARKIKSLWNVNLPKQYFLRDCEIRHKSLLGLNNYTVAEINIKEDIFTVSFKYEEDYKKLRKYFQDSETKFELIVNGCYY